MNDQPRQPGTAEKAAGQVVLLVSIPIGAWSLWVFVARVLIQGCQYADLGTGEKILTITGSIAFGIVMALICTLVFAGIHWAYWAATTPAAKPMDDGWSEAIDDRG